MKPTLLLVLLLLAAGCLVEPGATSAANSCGKGQSEFRAAPLSGTWSRPGGASRELFERANKGTCSGDQTWVRWNTSVDWMSLSLGFRVAGLEPRPLSYDADLSTQDTFRFGYEESAFWDGHTINQVQGAPSVANFTFKGWYERTPYEASVRGTLHLEFLGRCEAGSEECPESGPVPTIIDARF